MGWAAESYWTYSVSAWPRPWATAPCTCPSTSSGLITTPQSSTATTRSTRTRPVSGSTATTHAYEPDAYVSGGAPEEAAALMPPSRAAASATDIGASTRRAAASAAWQALYSAVPPATALREPNVPYPNGVVSVSPKTTVTSS